MSETIDQLVIEIEKTLWRERRECGELRHALMAIRVKADDHTLGSEERLLDIGVMALKALKGEKV